MHHLSDAELVEAARHGESAAFDVLFERYYAEACEFSSRFASPEVAPDRVTVAFARVYRALLRGRQYDADFQGVMHSAVRGVHADVVRRGRKEFLVDDDELEPGEVVDDNPIRSAFASLKPSWRKVLWFSVVLDESDDEVAERLGLTATQVAVLRRRAREGLRRACIAEGLPAPDDELGGVLTPSLVLDVPGTTAGRSPSRGVLAVLVGRLPEARPAALGAAGVAAAATVAVLVVVALASGSEDPSPPGDAQAPTSPADSSSQELPLSGKTLQRGGPTKKPTQTATSDKPTPSESVTPTTPIVTQPSDPPSSTEPATPSPTLDEQSSSASGNGLVRVARVTYGVTPLSADQVVVGASNVRFMSVTGSGVLCSGQSVSGGEGVVTCRVVASENSTFSLAIRVSYADTTQPVSGSVTLTGGDQTVSDGFSVAAE